ncbi:MAG: hypothetical protein BWY11_02144 [Firmicutes bacterium ADurb.Bin182]|nr:MAG: hypothetical protein BWY11_02144 [Firmicutes bacterium ADurb.Bin182]
MRRKIILLTLVLVFVALAGLALGFLSAKIEQAAERGRAFSFSRFIEQNFGDNFL